FDVTVIALAAFVVIPDDPSTVPAEIQAIFVIVGAAPDRLRNQPDNDLADISSGEISLNTPDQRCIHVGEHANTGACCQSRQHRLPLFPRRPLPISLSE